VLLSSTACASKYTGGVCLSGHDSGKQDNKKSKTEGRNKQ